MMLFPKRLISLTLLKIISLIIFTSCILGCSLFEKPPQKNEDALLESAPSQRIYFANYEDVWRSIHQVIKYPIASENQDSGMIETDFIKTSEGFQSPETEDARPKGTRYKLIFKLSKGKLKGRNSTRVVIEKQIDALKDFFSEPQRIPSDRLEEKVIFYRIERELIISEALKKVN